MAVLIKRPVVPMSHSIEIIDPLSLAEPVRVSESKIPINVSAGAVTVGGCEVNVLNFFLGGAGSVVTALFLLSTIGFGSTVLGAGTVF